MANSIKNYAHRSVRVIFTKEGWHLEAHFWKTYETVGKFLKNFDRKVPVLSKPEDVRFSVSLCRYMYRFLLDDNHADAKELQEWFKENYPDALNDY